MKQKCLFFPPPEIFDVVIKAAKAGIEIPIEVREWIFKEVVINAKQSFKEFKEEIQNVTRQTKSRNRSISS